MQIFMEAELQFFSNFQLLFFARKFEAKNWWCPEEHAPATYRKALIEIIAQNMVQVAGDHNGCAVLEKGLSYGEEGKLDQHIQFRRAKKMTKKHWVAPGGRAKDVGEIDPEGS